MPRPNAIPASEAPLKIYLFPLLMDLLTFMVTLRVADAAGREMALTDSQTAVLIGFFSLSYMVFCLVAGRLLSRKNARAVLIASVLLVAATAVPLFFTMRFWPTLGLLMGQGMGAAFFFNSFQTFMRGEAPPGALTQTIGRYTIAWSTGIGCGFLLGGVLRDVAGPLALAASAGLVCAIMLILIVFHRSRELERPSADGQVEQPDPEGRPVDRRFVAVGWSLILMGNFSQRPLVTFLPKFYAEMHRPSWMAGLLLGVLMLVQAVAGYRCQFMRSWFYRRTPLVVAQLAIMVVLGLLWRFQDFALSLGLIAAMGVVSGFVFFASPYYSSNDPNSSHNVGVNEAMVGVGNVMGALGCEWVMRLTGYRDAFYPVAMAVVALSLGFQLLWLRDRSPSPAPVLSTLSPFGRSAQGIVLPEGDFVPGPGADGACSAPVHGH